MFLVGVCHLPALARCVVLDFAELKLRVLIGGADASVDGCFHDSPFGFKGEAILTAPRIR
jgi:hypothetical protein